MKVCFVHLYYDVHNLALERDAYLEWVNLQQLPEEMARRGHEVHVIHQFPHDETFDKNGVHYHFRSSGRFARALASVVRKDLPATAEAALRPIMAIRRLQPDVIHFHGIVLTLNLMLLLVALGRQRPPLITQYHGGYPSKRVWGRLLQRALFRQVDYFLFGTRWHRQPFVDAGVLQEDDRVAEVMEVSTTFRYRARPQARAATGMKGNPVFLWAGRLHPVKDPLTALHGFERILRGWPQAHLYLHYLTDEMLPELRAFVAQHPQLAGHLHFRGRVPRPRMEDIYNSSDFLLQASVREFSGFAPVEAMACGVIPVITDIPAFRGMTDDGRLALLFPPGDDAALARQVLSTDLAQIPALSSAVREHFERELSFAAMATQLEQLYAESIVRRAEKDS